MSKSNNFFSNLSTGGIIKTSLTVGLVGVLGCALLTSENINNLDHNQTIISQDPYYIIKYINRNFGGVVALGFDRDYDGDGFSDAYIISRKGIVFATHSSDLSSSETRWYFHGWDL